MVVVVRKSEPKDRDQNQHQNRKHGTVRNRRKEQDGKKQEGKEMKRKILNAGDACRHCGTAVVRREHGPGKAKPKKQGSYYYAWWFQCPKCRALYMVEAAKRYMPSTEAPPSTVPALTTQDVTMKALDALVALEHQEHQIGEGWLACDALVDALDYIIPAFRALLEERNAPAEIKESMLRRMKRLTANKALERFYSSVQQEEPAA